jgi:hypothetical protein
MINSLEKRILGQSTVNSTTEITHFIGLPAEAICQSNRRTSLLIEQKHFSEQTLQFDNDLSNLFSSTKNIVQMIGQSQKFTFKVDPLDAV